MRKIKLFLLIFTLFISAIVSAQVGVGTTTPDSSAVLDVSSTTKGILFPRLTTAQRDAIILPATGLIIYNTTFKSIEVNIGTPATPIWVSTRGKNIFYPTDFGAIGNGDSLNPIDDTTAITACFAAAVAADGIVDLENKLYYVRGDIDIKCWKFVNPTGTNYTNSGRRSITIRGSGVKSGFLWEPNSKWDVLFRHAEGFRAEGFKVLRYRPNGIVPTDYIGTVFATPNNVQSFLSVFDKIGITGPFLFGRYARFSMEDSHRTWSSRDCAAHFAFLAVNLSSGSAPNLEDGTGDIQDNPVQGWNGGSTGFFHNTATFDAVICDGGEVGFIGTPMCFNFVHFVSQGQNHDPANNIILPIGDPGTGMYLFGPSSSRKIHGNAFGTYYTEFTRRSIYLKNSEGLVGQQAFFQGNVSGTQADNTWRTIEALDGGLISIGIVRLPGNVYNLVKASGDTEIEIRRLSGGGISTTSGAKKYDLTNGSTVVDNNGEPFVFISKYVKTTTDALTTYDLCELSTTKSYQIDIKGTANGAFCDATIICDQGVLSRIGGSHDFVIGALGIKFTLINSTLKLIRTNLYSSSTIIKVSEIGKIETF